MISNSECGLGNSEFVSYMVIVMSDFVRLSEWRRQTHIPISQFRIFHNSAGQSAVNSGHSFRKAKHIVDDSVPDLAVQLFEL